MALGEALSECSPLVSSTAGSPPLPSPMRKLAAVPPISPLGSWRPSPGLGSVLGRRATHAQQLRCPPLSMGTDADYDSWSIASPLRPSMTSPVTPTPLRRPVLGRRPASPDTDQGSSAQVSPAHRAVGAPHAVSPSSHDTFETACASDQDRADNQWTLETSLRCSPRTPLHDTSWNPFLDSSIRSFRGSTPGRKTLGQRSFLEPLPGRLNVHCLDGVEYLVVSATEASVAAIVAATADNAGASAFIAGHRNVWQASEGEWLMQMDLTSADGALLQNHLDVEVGLSETAKETLHAQLSDALSAVHRHGYSLDGRLSRDMVWASTARHSFFLCDLRAAIRSNTETSCAADFAALDDLVAGIPPVEADTSCSSQFSTTTPASPVSQSCPYAEALLAEIMRLEAEVARAPGVQAP